MKNSSKLILAAGITLAIIATPSLATVKEVGAEVLAPLPIHATTTQNIVDALSSRHYVQAVLNNELSSRIFDTYIEDLDPSKSYLLQSDVDEFEQYRYKMDDTLKRGNLSPAFNIFNRYHERIITRFEKVLVMLDEGLERFDFTISEGLLIDRENAPWAQTEAQLDDLWRKRVKNAVLNLKLADKKLEEIKELLHKRFSNRLTRSRQTNNEDVYQLYMNSFTKTYDPHTQYFSPRTSENFDINMSLSLEGIGAVLQREDEYTKVVSLVTAGPADKAGILKPNDKIVAVGQGKAGEMVDVIGWRLDEVVQLIRGPKDSVVRLDIIPASEGDADPKIISIVRNKVELEEQSAQSEVIELEQFGAQHKIGVVSIPTFYVDFKALQKGDRNYKSTTRDVKKLIRELQAQHVDGIVIDLRNNGGGSLQEAKLLTGLFIDRGPTVQIRTKSNRVDILDDRDISVIYDGPLAVLVNRLSASASEIFAGAIQDYERGIIIGSQTFGKGTVQSLLPLNRGQLKLTQAKFYRISGESTQEKGIIPDIEYPSSYDPESIGESTLDTPLPWDKIAATNYRRKHSINHLVPELKSLHDERVLDNADFNYLKEAFAYRKAHSEDDIVNLNEKQRLQEKSDREDFWLTLENKKRVALGQETIANLDELDEEEPTITSNDSPGAPAADPAIVPTNGDGDEIYNSMDDCPNTTNRHARIDARGCYVRLERKVNITLNVEFDFDSSGPSDEHTGEVQKVADFMRQHSNSNVVMEGHTDSMGSDDYNQGLSERRASMIADILVKKFNISPDRVSSAGYGENQPIATNDTTEGRQHNRRVVIVTETDDPGEKPEEEDTIPDPYLVETGHILLDLISLEERTA